MTTAEWLTLFGLGGGVIGYLEFRISRLDAGRHKLRDELAVTQRFVAKLMVKVFDDTNGH